jgi:hypothetical protein
MKTYWGSGGIVPRILDLGTRWGEWLASHSGRFTPRERAPIMHWIGSWVGPRAVLDTVVKRKIPTIIIIIIIIIIKVTLPLRFN